MKIIAFAGQMNAGKDVAANYLHKKLNEKIDFIEDKYRRVAFANGVKKVFVDTFKVTFDFVEEWKRKPENPPGFNKSVRQSLQFIGDGFRSIQPNIWVDLALKNQGNLIISDMRYFGEAKAIKEKYGLNILLWREGHENDDPNPSESQLKPIIDKYRDLGVEGRIADEYFDFFIRNNSDLEVLYAKIDGLIPEIIKHFSVMDSW